MGLADDSGCAVSVVLPDENIAFGVILTFPVSLLELSEAVSGHSPGIRPCERGMFAK